MSVLIKIIRKTENKLDWRDLLTINQVKRLEKLYPDIVLYGYSIFK